MKVTVDGEATKLTATNENGHAIFNQAPVDVVVTGGTIEGLGKEFPNALSVSAFNAVFALLTFSIGFPSASLQSTTMPTPSISPVTVLVPLNNPAADAYTVTCKPGQNVTVFELEAKPTDWTGSIQTLTEYEMTVPGENG